MFTILLLCFGLLLLRPWLISNPKMFAGRMIYSDVKTAFLYRATPTKSRWEFQVITVKAFHRVKRVRIRSFCDPYFPGSGGKTRTRKTSNYGQISHSKLISKI